MPVPMTRPWKHPKTGIYWLRKGVPESLRALVGKREVVRSLKTRDIEEAKVLLSQELLALNQRFAALKAGAARTSTATAKVLSEREAHDSARWMFGFWLDKHRENPSAQTFWPTSLFDRLWQSVDVPGLMSWVHAPTLAPLSATDRMRVQEMETWCRNQADHYADFRDWRLDEASRLKLAKAMGASVQRASLQLAAEAQGERPQPLQERSSSSGSRKQRNESTVSYKPVSIMGLLDEWWREAQAAGRKPSTYESYRSTTASLVTFLKHDDASRVTAHDIVAFKDHRLATPTARTGKPPSAKTVKDSDLSALKTIFGWATSNRKIDTNPAVGITIKLGKPPKTRSKGFTDEEAVAILGAAFWYVGDEDLACTAAAKRWVPWLCAFTGARVGEMAQLRKKDVTRSGKHWVLRITPEAGTVKTNQFREVVLHSCIVELGFTTFVEASKEGHLFLSPSANPNVRGRLKGLTNRLSDFARAVVTDRRVDPTRGWRHRFKTIGMDVGVSPRVLDAIQGHSPGSVADTYGDVTIKTIAAAIAKFPAITIAELPPDYHLSDSTAD